MTVLNALGIFGGRKVWLGLDVNLMVVPSDIAHRLLSFFVLVIVC